jgi:threonine/homoserine efflux transporter RhtA
MDGRVNPLMDRKVVVAVPFGGVVMVAVVTSPQLLDVVWCSAVVVVGVVVV